MYPHPPEPVGELVEPQGLYKLKYHLLQIPNPVRDDNRPRLAVMLNLIQHLCKLKCQFLHGPSRDSGTVLSLLLLIPLRKVFGVGGFHLADGFYKARNHSKI